jgi:hypothetical protein
MSTILDDIDAVGAGMPRVRWSAIFAGWLVATGIAWLMYLLGLAAGFTAIDANDAENVARGLTIGTGLWIILTWVVSLFLGGMFAAWFDGKTDHAVGTLHGIAVWALSITVTAVLVALGFTNILQASGSLIKGGATAATGIASAGAGAAARMGDNGPDTGMGAFTAQVRNQIAQAIAKGAQDTQVAQNNGGASASAGSNAPADANAPASANAGASAPAPAGAGGAPSNVTPSDVRKAMESIDKETASAVALDLVRGNTDQAKVRLAAETGLSQAQVDQAMQGLQQKADEYKAKAKEAADKTAKYSAAAMWALFVSVLVSLIAAAIGGWMGARNVHRVYDYEEV